MGFFRGGMRKENRSGDKVAYIGKLTMTDACGMVNVHRPVGNPKRKV
jgi:hypothetical protein